MYKDRVVLHSYYGTKKNPDKIKIINIHGTANEKFMEEILEELERRDV